MKYPTPATGRLTLLAGAALLATLLAACGGGGGGSSTDGTAAAVNGRVADGYIQGATVFWDCNDNATPDAGEIQATTGVGGKFIIAAAPSAQCTLSAYVPVGARDEDTPDQTNSRAYTLMATSSHPEFISPLSTLSRLATKADSSLSEAQADSQVATSLNLSGSIHTDYIAETGPDGERRHAVAKVLANVLQSHHTPGAISDGQAASYEDIKNIAPAISSADMKVPAAITNLTAPFAGFFGPSAPLSFIKRAEVDHYAARPNPGLGLSSAQITALNDIIALPAVAQATRMGVIHWSELSGEDMVNILKRMQMAGITGETNAAVQAAKDQAAITRTAFTNYYNDKIANENKFFGSDIATNLQFVMDTTFSAVEAVSGTVSATTGLPAADLRPFRSSPNIKKVMKASRTLGNVPDMVIALIKDAEAVIGEDGVAVKEALQAKDGEALTQARFEAVVHSMSSVVDVMKESLKKNDLAKAGSLFKGAALLYDGSKACEEDNASSECFGKALEVVETISEYFELPNRLQGSLLAVRAGFDAYTQGKEYAKETDKQVSISQGQWDKAWQQAMTNVEKTLYIQWFDYGGFEAYFAAYDLNAPAPTNMGNIQPLAQHLVSPSQDEFHAGLTLCIPKTADYDNVLVLGLGLPGDGLKLVSSSLLGTCLSRVGTDAAGKEIATGQIAYMLPDTLGPTDIPSGSIYVVRKYLGSTYLGSYQLYLGSRVIAPSEMTTLMFPTLAKTTYATLCPGGSTTSEGWWLMPAVAGRTIQRASLVCNATVARADIQVTDDFGRAFNLLQGVVP